MWPNKNMEAMIAEFKKVREDIAALRRALIDPKTCKHEPNIYNSYGGTIHIWCKHCHTEMKIVPSESNK